MSDEKKKNQKTLEGEIEKELEGGLEETSGEDDDDFTVKVHREEYIVKRRFYDKDKALETAESLRQDKRNLVEDNIEGEIESEIHDDDEHVDWDKLVDAGLVFDPPIAEAVEKKPGEMPVGLAEILEKKDGTEDKEIEKTLVMKEMPALAKLKQAKEPVEEPAVGDDTVDEGAVETEQEEKIADHVGEQPDEIDEEVVAEADVDEEEPHGSAEHEISAPKRVKPKPPVKPALKYILIVLVFVVAGMLFFLFKPSGKKPPVSPDPLDTGTVSMKIQKEDVVETPVETVPVADDDADGQKGVEDTSEPVTSEVAESSRIADEEPVSEEPVAEQLPDEPEVREPEVTVFHPYTVHVGSYKNKNGSLRAVSTLKKKGFDAFSGFVRIPGKGDWYRVYVGYNQTYQQAKASAGSIKKKAKQDGYPTKTPWSVQIGSASDSETVKSVSEMMLSRGYAVYSVPFKEEPSLSRVLTGAFKTEAEAAAMLDKMGNEGIDVKVVKR